ncbi:MAG: LysM peptidoglycan-binding domain-containing protein, partial [Verrucomicrobiota bacterium]
PLTSAPPPPAPSFDPFAPASGQRTAPTRPGAPDAFVPPSPPITAAPTPPVPATSYTVKSGDSLYAIGKRFGLTPSEIAKASNIAVNANLRPGQKLSLPAAPGKATAVPVLAGAADTNTYTVRSSDKLTTIAQRNRTTPEAIRALNNLAGDTVRAGQVLRLPVAAPSAAVLAPATTGGVTHTVKPGEVLGDIARKYGVKIGDIAAVNTIADPGKLRAGQVLKIPVKAAATVAPAAPSEDSPIRAAAPPPTSSPASTFNFTLPSSTPPGAPIQAAPPPPPSTQSGPVIKIEGDGAPRIP